MDVKSLLNDYFFKGLKNKEVCEKYNISYSELSNILKENNSKIRKDNIQDIRVKLNKDLANGITLKEASLKYKIGRSTIISLRKDIGMYDESKSNKKKYTDEEELEIVRRYLNGERVSELTKEYGFKTKKSIEDKVKKYGYKMRTTSESLMLKKPYKDFSMRKIDSEFKAYFLGLIASDGYLTNGRQVGIDLTDEDCISFLSKMIGKEYKTYERYERENKDKEAIRDFCGEKTRYRLILNGKRYVEDFMAHGVTERKSLTIKSLILDKDEKEFLPYIIRGLLDGDGWIRKDGKEFYICSASEKFATWIKDTLEKELDMTDLNLISSTPNKNYENSVMYYVRTSDQRNIEILKNKCYDKPYGMSRKYNLLHGKSSETTIEEL